VQAVCSGGAKSAWSYPLRVNIKKYTQRPHRKRHIVNTPATPRGTKAGYIGRTYTYTSGNSVCSLRHRIYYKFSWGDGRVSHGAATQSHKWTYPGTYYIRVQAVCSGGAKSAWSVALHVKISNSTESIDVDIYIRDAKTRRNLGHGENACLTWRNEVKKPTGFEWTRNTFLVHLQRVKYGDEIIAFADGYYPKKIKVHKGIIYTQFGGRKAINIDLRSRPNVFVSHGIKIACTNQRKKGSKIITDIVITNNRRICYELRVGGLAATGQLVNQHSGNRIYPRSNYTIKDVQLPIRGGWSIQVTLDANNKAAACNLLYFLFSNLIPLGLPDELMWEISWSLANATTTPNSNIIEKCLQLLNITASFIKKNPRKIGKLLAKHGVRISTKQLANTIRSCAAVTKIANALIQFKEIWDSPTYVTASFEVRNGDIVKTYTDSR
jgi:hypothetical protein